METGETWERRESSKQAGEREERVGDSQSSQTSFVLGLDSGLDLPRVPSIAHTHAGELRSLQQSQPHIRKTVLPFAVCTSIMSRHRNIRNLDLDDELDDDYDDDDDYYDEDEYEEHGYDNDEHGGDLTGGENTEASAKLVDEVAGIVGKEFPKEQIQAALRQNQNDSERAVNFLLDQGSRSNHLANQDLREQKGLRHWPLLPQKPRVGASFRSRSTLQVLMT
ncbi:uncharacterized protein EV422DRAFT_57646 [Fimicolochytrium jonesii]|uniref:uncharacterized protein n=1 Tax=Fimicolochytrium jonesii TaxID=1396493 RepID=UPI0022FF4407|nr:uncharacterized protein EV422DRAFT_57646 [Fimicolochytrium jonesii]KAI8820642.1 hypothetical protein EV422DRAFT_57646 [Fimicolochytrium jonesii]